MMIADAQVHIWAADTPERPWPKVTHGYAHREIPLGIAELVAEMDGAGVDRAVIVPPSWEGDRNDLAQEACRLHPGRFAIMGRIPVAQPAPEKLATWRDQSGFLGLRFTIRPEHTWFKDGTGDWAFAAAEKYGLPVMMSCVGNLPLVDKLAERHPGLKIVVDHLALRRVKDDAAFADLPSLLAMAKRPNVAAKASALPCFSSEAYPYRNLHPYIRQVFDAFGPRRMFWGTDISRLPCTYRQAVTMFTEELPFLSADDKEWVMGKALCAWLGWPA
jgi:predicted TIM-barrel fold metal-dependent hydrolase